MQEEKEREVGHVGGKVEGETAIWVRASKLWDGEGGEWYNDRPRENGCSKKARILLHSLRNNEKEAHSVSIMEPAETE